jgi:hypothetical protein
MKTLLSLIFLTICSLSFSQEDEALLKMAEKIKAKIETSTPVTFLFTDKFIYSPEEKIDVIISNKNFNTRHPEYAAMVFFVLIDETGSIILHEKHNVENTNFNSSLSIPKQARNGKYTLLALLPYKNSTTPLCYKEIIITDEPAQNAFYEIQFDKSNYYKQRTISGTISVFNVENSPIKNTEVNITLVADNTDIEKLSLKLNENGQAQFSYSSVEELVSNKYFMLRAELKYNNVLNIKNEPIPIYQKDDIFIKYFPEGGNLVAGIPNSLVVQITDKNMRPLEVSGFLYDDKNIKLAKVETNPEGYARFKLIANSNTHYYIKLNNPEIEENFEVERIKNDGLTLNVEDNLSDKINITASNSPNSNLLKTFWYIISGGEIISSNKVEIKAKKTIQMPYSILTLNDFVEIIITDTLGNLLADRVVFPRTVSPEGSVQGLITDNNIVLTGKLPQNFYKCNISVFPSYIEKSIQKTLLSTNNLNKLLNNAESFNLSLYTDRYSRYLADNKIDTIHSIYIKGKVLNKKNVPAESGNVFAINPLNLETKTSEIDKNGEFSITWSNGIIDIQNLTFKATGNLKNAQIIASSSLNMNYFAGYFPDEKNWEAKKIKSLYYNKYPQYLYQGNFKTQNIINTNSSELTNVLNYSTYNSVLDIIKSEKPLSVNNNKICFLSQGVNSTNSIDGAIIVINGQNMGQDISALDQIEVKNVAGVFVSTNFVDIQRYSALNTMGVIEIKTCDYLLNSQEITTEPSQSGKFKESEYSIFKQQNMQDLSDGSINFNTKNVNCEILGIISTVNEQGEIFMNYIPIRKAQK